MTAKEKTAAGCNRDGQGFGLRDMKAEADYSTSMHDVVAYMGAAAVAERNMARLEGRPVRNADVRWTNARAVREIARHTGVHPTVDVLQDGRRVLAVEYGDTYSVRFVAEMDGGAY